MKKIAEKIASANLGWVVVSFFIIGAIITAVGAYAELQNELNLLKTGGVEALANYHLQMHAFASLQSELNPTAMGEFFSYVALGLKRELPSAGGNLEVIGLTVAYVGASIGAIVVLASRIAGGVKQTTTKENEFPVFDLSY